MPCWEHSERMLCCPGLLLKRDRWSKAGQPLKTQEAWQLQWQGYSGWFPCPTPPYTSPSSVMTQGSPGTSSLTSVELPEALKAGLDLPFPPHLNLPLWLGVCLLLRLSLFCKGRMLRPRGRRLLLRATFTGPFKDFLRTFFGLSPGFLRTLSGLSQDFLRTFTGLS